ncbi:MAG: AbrB/MazE/SpoVT family DNA-binding domain-containing protein [Lachnospiraceae bacterium]|nr:AbrB/MazE/SpoVT family DNA-binding domain-containing protein [Lachnospiraceae bacterium]
MIYYFGKRIHPFTDSERRDVSMPEGKLFTTRPFMSGRSQAIRIPKELRFEDTEVVINRVGESLMITPKSALASMFFSGIEMLSDDFLSEGRPEEIANERITF